MSWNDSPCYIVINIVDDEKIADGKVVEFVSLHADRELALGNARERIASRGKQFNLQSFDLTSDDFVQELHAFFLKNEISDEDYHSSRLHRDHSREANEKLY